MGKVLILYAYHESPSSKVNLEFFTRFGFYRRDDVESCLIVNGEICSADVSKWSRVLFRKNEGYDFNAWYHGLKEYNRDEFEHFIFMNDTIRGPFGDRHWIKTFTDLLNDEVKLAGISINCHVNLYAKHHQRESVPHVQSMFFCTDRVGLNLISPSLINDEILGKEETVIYKEIGISLQILKAGYNISCILPRYRVDYRDPKNCLINTKNGFHGDPMYPDAYFGRSLHPLETIFFKTNRRISEEALREFTSVQNQMQSW